MTVSDWYHDQAPTLISRYHAVGVPPDAVPIPDAALINDAQNTKFNIQPGKTYLVRAVNIGALAPIVLYFDRHNMTIVEIDGVYTKKFVAEQILLAPAQRYSFLITAKRHPTRNFAFLASMFQGQFPPNLQSHFQQHVNGYLIYDSAKPLPPPVTLSALTPIDDFQLVPYDQQPILSPVTQRITINMAFGSVDGIPRYNSPSFSPYGTPC
jgi:iron transport multicopper oxidase